MPVQNLRFIARQTTDDSADDVIWTFGVDGPTITSGNIAALITAFQFAMSSSTLNADLAAGLEFYYAEALPATGGAATGVLVMDPGQILTGTGQAPAELAVAVSRLVSSARGPSPRGRLYIGPLDAAAGNSARPSVGLQDRALEFMLDFDAAVRAEGWEPVVVSKNGFPQATGNDIIGYRTDDAWDVQRRRGWAPTAFRSV